MALVAARLWLGVAGDGGSSTGADAGGAASIPIRPICEVLGLLWGSQRNRLYRDEVLREAVRGVFITNTPGTGGGTQEMVCLPLDLLPGWLFGVSTQRVKPELHERILRYRRDCFRVLWDAFKHDILPSALTPTRPTGGAEMAYELATAVQSLAREQMEMERRIGTMETSQGTCSTVGQGYRGPRQRA